MAFSDKQQQFFLNATHRWNIKTGATRSGKTFMDYTVISKRILNTKGNGLIVLLGNTKGTLERNILEPMRNIWSNQLVGNISSDNTVRIFGKKCYALGADKANQVSKIQGAGIEYCYGDEVTTWNEELFNMLKSRLDKPNSCFDGTCNPDNPNHWFKRFLDSNADIYQQAYTIYDNPFLTQQFVQNLEREYAGSVYFDRFILGKWCAAEGAVYRQFAHNAEPWLVDEPQRDIDFISVGVDFGGNRSLTTFVATAVHYNFSRLTVLRDYHIKGEKGDIDSDRVSREFIGFIQQLQTDFPGVYIKYGFMDSEAQYLINSVRRACQAAGLTIQIFDSAKNEIVQRIICTNTLLNVKRLYICRCCKLLIAGLQTAVWDTNKAKDTRLDDFSSDIDILDAFEYSFERFMNKLVPGMARQQGEVKE